MLKPSLLRNICHFERSEKPLRKLRLKAYVMQRPLASRRGDKLVHLRFWT